MDQQRNILMVRNPDHRSRNLFALLSASSFATFHHAPFDLKHIVWWTGYRFLYEDVICTKIQCKFARPTESSSLYKVIPALTKQNPYKEKSTTLSNWNAKELDAEQITYACTDVFFLLPISYKLGKEIIRTRKDLECEDATSAACLSAYVEVAGYADTLSYEGQPNPKLRQLWDKRRKVMKDE